MKEKNVETEVCKHKPRMLVGVLTVTKDITCQKCGHKYYYENKKVLLATTVVLWILLSAFYIFATIWLFRIIRDRPLTAVIGAPLLFILYRLLFAFVARLIYIRFGKAVTVEDKNR